jgi:hypothetical protein
MQEKEHLGISWFFDVLEFVLYGYGTRPVRPVMWSLLIVLGFGLFFSSKGGLRKLIQRDEIGEKPSEGGSRQVLVSTILIEKQVTFLDYIFYSLSNFTSGFSSFIDPLIIYNFPEEYRRLVVIERLIGSLLITLILTTVARTYLIR